MLTYDNPKRHTQQAFIDFVTDDAAQLAIETTDGLQLGSSRELRVSRPGTQGLQEVSFVLQRLYIANIQQQVTDIDIKELFGVFGIIKGCSLPPQISNKRQHQGYGYIDFERKEDASNALAMNRFPLCGMNLRVGQSMMSGPLPPSIDQSALKRKLKNLADKFNKKLKGQS